MSFQFAYDALSSYPITIMQAVVILIVVSCFVTASFSAFIMMLSVKCKTSFLPVIIALLSVFLPLFIPNMNNRVANQIIKLFPINTYEASSVFSETFYNIAGISILPFVFIIILSALIMLIFMPLIYMSFKKYQVS